MVRLWKAKIEPTVYPIRFQMTRKEACATISPITMDTELQINLDRLVEGVPTKVEAKLSPEVMEPHEADLQFLAPVAVEGECYLTPRGAGALMVSLTCKTRIVLFCRVCNRQVEVDLVAKEACDAQELERHQRAEFDLLPLVRELVFVEVPQFVECEGKCPRREELEPFLHKNEEYHPFADLKEKDNGSST